MSYADLGTNGESFGVSIRFGDDVIGLANGNASFSAQHSIQIDGTYVNTALFSFFLQLGTTLPTGGNPGSINFRLARGTDSTGDGVADIVDDSLPNTDTFNVAPSLHNNFDSCLGGTASGHIANISPLEPLAVGGFFAANVLVTDLPRYWQVVAINGLTNSAPLAIGGASVQQVNVTPILESRVLA